MPHFEKLLHIIMVNKTSGFNCSVGLFKLGIIFINKCAVELIRTFVNIGLLVITQVIQKSQ
jgi:hypothetical protein